MAWCTTASRSISSKKKKKSPVSQGAAAMRVRTARSFILSLLKVYGEPDSEAVMSIIQMQCVASTYLV